MALLDWNQVGALPQDQAIALLRQHFATPAGEINWQTMQGGGGDPYAVLADAQGNQYDWSQATRPEVTDGGNNGVNLSNAMLQRALTETGTSAVDPTQYGHYTGTYGSDGNLRDVKWTQEDKSGGWFSDNLDWLGPLIVGGFAAAGAGGLLPTFDGGAGIGSAVGTDAAFGGAAADTLGGTTAESLLSQAPAYDSLVSGAMPSSITGSGLGAGIGANGILGAMDAAPYIGTGSAVSQALGGVAADALGSGAGSAVGSALGALGTPQVIGAALGALASGQTQGGTQSREPWAPAQEWLKAQIANGQKLQQAYQAQPFNEMQQTAYQNLFSNADAMRSQIAPGLLEQANQLMGRQYVAPTVPTMPQSGSTALPQFNQGYTTSNPVNIFQAPQGSAFGGINWNALNSRFAG